MLTIGSEQWAALAAAEYEDFVAKLVAYTRARHADRFWRVTAIETRAAVTRILGIAASYGLRSERAGVLFVDLVADFGPSFPKGNGHEWARTILDHPTLSPGQKTFLLASVYDDSGDIVANDAASGRFSITDEPRP